MPESIYERREGWGRIAPARIIEMVALEGRTPVRKHLPQPPTLDMSQDEVRGHIGKTDAVQRRVYRGSDVAQGELALHPHAELTAVALEFPGIKPPGRWKAKVDAIVACQVLRD